jgi:hypothetical protein
MLALRMGMWHGARHPKLIENRRVKRLTMLGAVARRTRRGRLDAVLDESVWRYRESHVLY